MVGRVAGEAVVVDRIPLLRALLRGLQDRLGSGLIEGHYVDGLSPGCQATNITTAPVSSSKFDFNIRFTIALQLLERFRLWVIRVILAVH